MGRRELAEADETNENAARFRQQHQRNQPEVPGDDGPAQNPRDDEGEQIINDVGDAVVAAERGGGDAEFAGEDAVKNVRERSGEQDGQKDEARNIRKRAKQGDGAKQQPQGGEREWEVAFQFRNLMI